MKKVGNIISFTLVELLIVISIIAILATLLFPSLSKAMSKARSISCISNMKQLGMVFNQYSVDFDGRMPMHKVSYSVYPWSYYKRELFTMNYLKESDPINHYTATIDICTENRLLIEKSLGITEACMYGSYNYNGYYANNKDFTIPIIIGNLQKPSSCGMYNHGINGTNFMSFPQNYPHSGKTNILFFDLHAENKKISDIPTSYSNVFWTGR